MPYQIQQPAFQNQNPGQADTTNLGYQFPGGAGANAGAMWNSFAPTPPANSVNPFGAAAPGVPGASASGSNGAYSLQNLINQQMQQNNAARQQNQQNWNSAKAGVLGVPGQYASQGSTGAAQGLTSQLAANPLSLSPTIVQQMKNQSANNVQAQSDNSTKQLMGTLAAGGQTDASTLAALKASQDRQALGANTTANTNIDIAAAKQRPQDLINAAGVAQHQSAQDIAPGMQANESVMSNLPQVKPDDLSGLLALSNQNSFQNALLGMQANQTGALHTPTAYNPIGGSYSQSQNQGPGTGFMTFPAQGLPQGGSTNFSGGGSFPNSAGGMMGGVGGLPSAGGGGGSLPYYQNGQNGGSQNMWDRMNQGNAGNMQGALAPFGNTADWGSPGPNTSKTPLQMTANTN